jgi:uncharacterized protein
MASDPLIENLLVYQERDVRSDDLRRNFEDIPARLAALEKEISAAKAVYMGRLEQQKVLELKRRDLERRTLESEDQRVRLRTQQLTVKKNEEYSVLERQIEASTALIDQLETETIETMIQSDDFGPVVEKQKAATETDIAAIRARIASVERLREALEKDLTDAALLLQESRAKIPPDKLATYAYVKSRVKHPPYLTPLTEMRCTGCHLKVSGEVLSAVRTPGALARCDGCGRLLYLER